jgi:hypothetical protein
MKHCGLQNGTSPSELIGSTNWSRLPRPADRGGSESTEMPTVLS